MKRSQYAMLMFTLVLILGRVSPEVERGMWDIVAGAWFIVMIINLVGQLIDYGKGKKE